MLHEGGVYPKSILCHLLIRSSGIHLFLHGTHAILDGRPTLAAMNDLFQSISDPSAGLASNDLSWGSEIVNLPPGPVSSTGGTQSGAETEVPHLIWDICDMMDRSRPPEAPTPPRQVIENQGLSVRAFGIIREDDFQKIRGILKANGLTVTVLIEAAFATAILVSKKACNQLEEDSHITFDCTMIALNKYFTPLHTGIHMISALSYVPVIAEYKNLLAHSSPVDALFDIMNQLKAQYRKWVESPRLPHLSYQWILPERSNPNSMVMSNIGIVEDFLPLKYPAISDKPVVELLDMFVGHRPANFLHPIFHSWTFKGDLHLQISGSDIWNKADHQSLINNAIFLCNALCT
ncbi:hypothetical protein NEOLEDRAFT_769391 [Neolentinus lepideus HHB14362 ss-1]|uniref:Condensation domain-containing protein n=1 Tax=Neolentinus lepideus HHB14362 ss-1 TaxID=1314782 RepID=A0A165UTQ4_9AGAM|nr:hypothetical protein NEOLEDRAFT_769391 [Neolentinus lepideus HHB14362 ss-1]